MLFEKEQGLQINAMQIDDEEFEILNIGMMDMESLLPSSKESIIETNKIGQQL